MSKLHDVPDYVTVGYFPDAPSPHPRFLVAVKRSEATTVPSGTS
jgi:hypothetical protein